MGKFWTKNALFRYLWARILKSYCHTRNQHPQICLFANFTKKEEFLNLRPKMPHLRSFQLEFENNIVIFEISTFEFVQLQNFVQKQKCLNLGPERLIWVF